MENVNIEVSSYNCIGKVPGHDVVYSVDKFRELLDAQVKMRTCFLSHYDPHLDNPHYTQMDKVYGFIEYYVIKDDGYATYYVNIFKPQDPTVKHFIDNIKDYALSFVFHMDKREGMSELHWLTNPYLLRKMENSEVSNGNYI